VRASLAGAAVAQSDNRQAIHARPAFLRCQNQDFCTASVAWATDQLRQQL